MRKVSLLALTALLLASTAEAGKKNKKKKDEAESAPAVEEATAPASPAAPTPEELAASVPTLEVPCGMEQGDVHRYRVEKLASQVTPEGPTSRHHRYLLDVTVASYDDGVSVLEVDNHDLEVVSSDDPLFAPLMEKADEVEVAVRVRVDHEQGDVEVLNLEELMAAYVKVADEAVTMMKANDPELPPEALEAVRAMITSPQLAQQNVMSDLEPLIGYGCGKLPTEPVPLNTTLPNPLGGPPLPARGSVVARRAGGSIDMEMREAVDAAQVSALLGPLLEQMQQQLPEEERAQLDAMGGLSSEVALDVSFDAETGWPRSVRSERSVGFGPVQRTDRMEMTLRDED